MLTIDCFCVYIHLIYVHVCRLGGIITWDILSNQHLGVDGRSHSKLDLHFPKLDFKPDYLFTLGSPLSAFLTVRNQDPKVYHPDPSIVFENIFHPFDPLVRVNSGLYILN